MFTEGEKRWIKKHTEKSLKELYNRKGTNIKDLFYLWKFF